jgi:hypothetical protein
MVLLSANRRVAMTLASRSIRTDNLFTVAEGVEGEGKELPGEV